MQEAWPVSTPEGARRYRDGFAVVLLAAASMRIANFSALRLGNDLKRDEERWSIFLAEGETKTGASDVWPLSSEVSAHLDRYLQFVRPHLQSAGSSLVQTDHLWIGDSGRPVGQQIVRRWINRLTETDLGVRIRPHSFRHCAATTYSLERPSRSVEASALLGHASAATTERSYIIQQRQIAQNEYLALLITRRRASSAKMAQTPDEQAGGAS
jgi:integrase